MDRITVWLLLVSLFVVLNMSKSEEEEARNALVKFYSQLSRSNGSIDPSIGWHMNSDPCIGKWEGVFCDSKNVSVKKIVLDGFSLSGGLDAASLCKPESLAVMNLLENNFMGRYLARDWEFCLMSPTTSSAAEFLTLKAALDWIVSPEMLNCAENHCLMRVLHLP